MDWRRFVNEHFVRLVFIFWFVSILILAFLLRQLDFLIHHDLYNHGLQFDLSWADPYWATLRLIYIWLFGPLILGAIAFTFDLWRRRERNLSVTSLRDTHVPKNVSPRQDVENRGTPPIELKSEPAPVKDAKSVPVRGTTIFRISCPSCDETFTRPLAMLDFSGKNPKLINVCPYCNAKLGASNNNNNNSEESGIIDSYEGVSVKRS